MESEVSMKNKTYILSHFYAEPVNADFIKKSF